MVETRCKEVTAENERLESEKERMVAEKGRLMGALAELEREKKIADEKVQQVGE